MGTKKLVLGKRKRKKRKSLKPNFRVRGRYFYLLNTSALLVVPYHVPGSILASNYLDNYLLVNKIIFIFISFWEIIMIFINFNFLFKSKFVGYW